MNKPSPDDPPLRVAVLKIHSRNRHSLLELLSAISHRPSAIGHLQFAICHLPSTIRHLPSVVYHRTVYLILLLALLTGCVSKSTADARARAAFIAGQQQAMMQMQQNRGGGPSVTIIGAVRNSVLPCSAGLTLARALVVADYFGPDPTQIVLVRSGRALLFDPKKLLSGEDVPLQPGDMVEIRTNPTDPNPESPGTLSPVPK